MRASDATKLYLPTQEDLNAVVSALREGRLQHSLVAGSVCYRILAAPTRETACEYARVCYPSTVESRFSPITVDGRIVPTAYASSSRIVAIWEVPFRGIRHQGLRQIPPENIRGYYLVEACTRRDLQLLDLRRPTVCNLVSEGRLPPDLMGAGPGEYDMTRAWAQALLDYRPGIDGFIYESHQVPGDCIVLFQVDDVEIFEVLGDAMSLNEKLMRSLLRSEAMKVGAVVDFGDVSDEG